MRHPKLSSLALVLGVFILLVSSAACGPVPGPTETVIPTVTPGVLPPTTTAPGPTADASSNLVGNLNGQMQVLPWLSIFFTNPAQTDEADQNLDDYVVHYPLAAVNAAQKTIDITSFDFNLPGFVNALVAAKKRGVVVRIVLDEKNGSQDVNNGEGSDSDVPTDTSNPAPAAGAFDILQTLADAKIQVVNGGRSNGLMHDKIIIVDGKTLFMGSWNMSYNDTFRNNNNLLMITDPTLIANYQAKFNELFVDKVFGTKAKVGAATSALVIGGLSVENYFSPIDHVMDKLVAKVKAAKKSIRFIAFTYTDKRLSDAMIAQAKAGLTVQGVIENRGASQGAFVPLFCAKLAVETDGNKYTMHHKAIILDDSTVITGSFNFTATADDANDDNVLIFNNAPGVAAQYLQEFGRVYRLGKTPAASSVKCSSQ